MPTQERQTHEVQTSPSLWHVHPPASPSIRTRRDKEYHAEATGFIGRAEALESRYAQSFTTEVKLQGPHRWQLYAQKLSSDQLTARDSDQFGKPDFSVYQADNTNKQPPLKKTKNPTKPNQTKQKNKTPNPACLSFPQI